MQPPNKFYIIICLSFALALTTLSAQSERENLREEIKKIIFNDTDISNGPAQELVISVIDGDSIFTVAIDVDKTERELKTDALYELGSVSKSITASLVMRLIHLEFLAEDGLINEYLPTQYQNPRCESITVSSLLSHVSPLPRRPSYFGKISTQLTDPYAEYGRKELLEFYRDFIPTKNEKGFSYAHTNYALLEIIIESVTGLSFEEACQKYLFDPLNMNHTIAGNPENLQGLLAQGYDRAARPANYWHFRSFVASEGIRSNALDLSRFIQAHLQYNNKELDPQLIATQELITQTNLGKDLYAGYGWFIVKRRKKYNIYTMSGHTTGHRVELAFIPETNTGVVLLGNCNSGAEDLVMLVLRMINNNWKRKT